MVTIVYNSKANVIYQTILVTEAAVNIVVKSKCALQQHTQQHLMAICDYY